MVRSTTAYKALLNSISDYALDPRNTTYWDHEDLTFGSPVEDHVSFIRSKNSKVEVTKSYLPRQCEFSGKNIMSKKAYRVTNVYKGAHDTYTIVKWYDYDTFLQLLLME